MLTNCATLFKSGFAPHSQEPPMKVLPTASAAALFVLAANSASAAGFALQCGKTFDSASARLLGAKTVVVEGNRIKAVLDGKTEVDGVQSVDLSGHTCSAGFTTVRDLGGEIIPALRDSINQGLVPGPRIWAAGKSIATTGGHADPTNGLNHFLSDAVGHPGPEDGVGNSPEEARQSSRSMRSGRWSTSPATTATRWPRTRTARKA